MSFVFDPVRDLLVRSGRSYESCHRRLKAQTAQALRSTAFLLSPCHWVHGKEWKSRPHSAPIVLLLGVASLFSAQTRDPGRSEGRCWTRWAKSILLAEYRLPAP